MLSNQQELLNIIFDAIYDQYLIWQDEYGYDVDEREILMTDVSKSFELRTLLCPEKIFIMDVESKGIPYIGIQFNCKWDEEHGVGLMLYKNKVIKLGGSDTAFMSWIAEEDKEKSNIH